MIDKLKPCPFCGGTAVFAVYQRHFNGAGVGFEFSVKCRDCSAQFPEQYDADFTLAENGEIITLNDRRSEAIQKWNRRTGDE